MVHPLASFCHGQAQIVFISLCQHYEKDSYRGDIIFVKQPLMETVTQGLPVLQWVSLFVLGLV